MIATICQIIVLFDLTLIAISVALFVFTSSIYKGAVKLAAEEEEGHLARRRELMQERRREIRKSLGDVSEEDFPLEMKKKVDELNKDVKALDRLVKKSRNKVNALGLRNLVAFPALIIVSSIATSGIAVLNSGITQTIFWIVSMAFLGAGMFYLYYNLKGIENISGVIDLATLMEQALDSQEQKKKPVLELTIWDEELEVGRGEILELEYDIWLKQGNIGRNARCMFTATEGLEFPDEDNVIIVGTDYHGMKEPKRITKEHGDVHPKEYSKETLRIKAPDESGEYGMSYFLQCDEFTKDEYFFAIKVT